MSTPRARHSVTCQRRRQKQKEKQTKTNKQKTTTNKHKQTNTNKQTKTNKSLLASSMRTCKHVISFLVASAFVAQRCILEREQARSSPVDGSWLKESMDDSQADVLSEGSCKTRSQVLVTNLMMNLMKRWRRGFLLSCPQQIRRNLLEYRKPAMVR